MQVILGLRYGTPWRCAYNNNYNYYNNNNNNYYYYYYYYYYNRVYIQVILGSRYGTAVDMWSLGCIVAELVTGRPLFTGCDEADQLASQLEYLGMPPVQLLARSRRAGEFFSTTTNLPRYCTVTVR